MGQHFGISDLLSEVSKFQLVYYMYTVYIILYYIILYYIILYYII